MNRRNTSFNHAGGNETTKANLESIRFAMQINLTQKEATQKSRTTTAEDEQIKVDDTQQKTQQNSGDETNQSCSAEDTTLHVKT